MYKLLKILCISGLACLLHVNPSAQTPDYVWLKYGRSSDFKGICITEANDIIITGSNRLITATNQPFQTRRINPYGLELSSIDGDGGYGNDVTTDSQGNIIIAGSFFNTFRIREIFLKSDVNVECFLMKVDRDLNILWVHQTLGLDPIDLEYRNNRGKNIAVDKQDNVYFSGYFNETISFGDTILTATVPSTNFLAKYDKNGELQWVRTYGGRGTNYANSSDLDVDDEGHIYAAGLVKGECMIGDSATTGTNNDDIVICKYDGQGNMHWFHRFGGKDTDIVGDIVCTNNNDILICGAFNDTTTFGDYTVIAGSDPYGFGADGFVAKLDSDGDVEWIRTFTGPGMQIVYGLGVDPTGNILCTGSFSDSVTFGGTTIVNAGYQTGLLIELDASGEFIWHKIFGSDLPRDVGYHIEYLSNGDIILGGTTNKETKFGELAFDTEYTEIDFLTRLNRLPVPEIIIQNFDTDIAVGGIEVKWEVLPGGSIKGYRLYRRALSESRRKIIADLENNNTSFLDREVYVGHQYKYVLAVIVSDGTEIYSLEQAIRYGTNDAKLEQNFPNPFNPTTTIRFWIPQPGRIQLNIYDVGGRLVDSLDDGISNQGLHEHIWNGTDAFGKPVSAGFYFCRLKYGEQIFTRKMLLLK